MMKVPFHPSYIDKQPIKFEVLSMWVRPDPTQFLTQTLQHE